MSSALISPDALSRELNDQKLHLLDASYYLPGQNRDPRQEHEVAHLPGAQFFDIDEASDAGSNLPHMLPSSEAFQTIARKLGIKADDKLIIYDTNPMFGSCRAWWMFRAFGHEEVFVLDGGLPRWVREGYSTTNTVRTRAPSIFRAKIEPGLVATIEDVYEILGGTGIIVDARSPERFEGLAPEPRPGLRKGHMPGAINIPYTSLIDDRSHCMRPHAFLENVFHNAGVSLDRKIIASCGSGITACVVALAMYELGRPHLAVYDGSWAEWGSKADTPITTSAHHR